MRASAIGEHCGSYSEWWLDVAPLASSGAGDSSVRRELVVAATTTFNYTQVRIYGSEGLMVDLGPFYTQTCYSFLISRCCPTSYFSQCELVRGGEGFFLYGGITRSVEWHTLTMGTPLFIQRVEVTTLSLGDIAESDHSLPGAKARPGPGAAEDAATSETVRAEGTISVVLFLNATLKATAPSDNRAPDASSLQPPVFPNPGPLLSATVTFAQGQHNDDRTVQFHGLKIETTQDCVNATNFGVSNFSLPFFEHCTLAHRLALPQPLRVPNTTLWSADSPGLHTITVILRPSPPPPSSSSSPPTAAPVEEVLDGASISFGMRLVRAEGHRLLVNGVAVQLRGFDRHEQLDSFGASLPHAQLFDDADLLADVGANFVRGSHYPQDPRWLEVTDRRGIFVWSENFYGWPFASGPAPPPSPLSSTVRNRAEMVEGKPATNVRSDGSLQQRGRGEELPATTDPVAWMRASLRSLDEMIDAGFNHPSIIIWAFFNEGPDNAPWACPAYELVAARIRQRDPSRLVSWASRYGAAAVCDKHADIVARNVYPGWHHLL